MKSVHSKHSFAVIVQKVILISDKANIVRTLKFKLHLEMIDVGMAFDTWIVTLLDTVMQHSLISIRPQVKFQPF